MVRNKLKSGRTRTTLSIEQVRMILRIYYVDRHHRPGLSRATIGLRDRLAQRFGVSPEVIKKIVGMKRGKRTRFKSIAVQMIKQNVTRLERRYGGTHE